MLMQSIFSCCIQYGPGSIFSLQKKLVDASGDLIPGQICPIHERVVYRMPLRNLHP